MRDYLILLSKTPTKLAKWLITARLSISDSYLSSLSTTGNIVCLASSGPIILLISWRLLATGSLTSCISEKILSFSWKVGVALNLWGVPSVLVRRPVLLLGNRRQLFRWFNFSDWLICLLDCWWECSIVRVGIGGGLASHILQQIMGWFWKQLVLLFCCHLLWNSWGFLVEFIFLFLLDWRVRGEHLRKLYGFPRLVLYIFNYRINR